MLQALMPENLRDIRLSGQVIYVGRSSLEVAVKMEGYHPGSGEHDTYMIGKSHVPLLSPGL